MRYPGWTLDGPTAIPAASLGLADLPIAGHALLGWLRPTFGIALADGIGVVDTAAAFETHAVTFTARALPVSTGGTVTTRHGLVLTTTPLAEPPRLDRLLVPGIRHSDDIPTHLWDWATLARVPVEALTGPSGTTGFDGALEHLAGHAGRRTAVSAAKMLDYPTTHLELVARGGSARRSFAAAVGTPRRTQRPDRSGP
jgi:hypothetical protein